MCLVDSAECDKLDSAIKTAKQIMSISATKLSHEIGRGWTQLVKAEANKGGGFLFRYISKFDKSFLKVDRSVSKGDNSSPDLVLSGQVKKWIKFWNPSDIDLNKLTQESADFREIALQEVNKNTMICVSIQNLLKHITKTH